jgi:hypothetical protein
VCQRALKILYANQPVKLHVKLSLPGPCAVKTFNVQAVVDSGASQCVFHADFARALGLDLTAGSRAVIQGIGGATDGWVHKVCIHFPDDDQPVTTHAAFREGIKYGGLLGMKGFFEHFIVTFDPTASCCEIKRIVP